MRLTQTQQLFLSASATGSFDCQPFSIERLNGYAVQISWTNEVTGTISLAASCDPGTEYERKSKTIVPNPDPNHWRTQVPNFDINHWTTITSPIDTRLIISGTSGGTAVSPLLLNVGWANWKWNRIEFDGAPASTGSISATWCAKGVD